MEATKRNNAKAVTLLLDYGATLDAKDEVSSFNMSSQFPVE